MNIKETIGELEDSIEATQKVIRVLKLCLGIETDPTPPKMARNRVVRSAYGPSIKGPEMLEAKNLLASAVARGTQINKVAKMCGISTSVVWKAVHGVQMEQGMRKTTVDKILGVLK